MSKRVWIRMIWFFYLAHLKKIVWAKIIKVRILSWRGMFLKVSVIIDNKEIFSCILKVKDEPGWTVTKIRLF